MAKKEYSFYPGCSSQKGASGSNYQVSVDAMCDVLDIKLNHIPDWNCCAASIGYAGGGELPRLALSARNMALSEQAIRIRTWSRPVPPAGWRRAKPRTAWRMTTP